MWHLKDLLLCFNVSFLGHFHFFRGVYCQLLKRYTLYTGHQNQTSNGKFGELPMRRKILIQVIVVVVRGKPHAHVTVLCGKGRGIS